MRAWLIGTLMVMAVARADAQVVKPAGIRAGGASARKSDSAGAATSPSLVPPKIEMPATAKPAIVPPRRTDGPTARERAGLAKATKKMQGAPTGTPASSGRARPPAPR